jgi:hypothetical protein
MLPWLIDAIVVLVNNAEVDHFENVRGWVCGFRQVAADDFDLDAAVRSSGISFINVSIPHDYQSRREGGFHPRASSAQVG